MEADWRKDYHGEFICPYCQQFKLVLWGFNRQRKKHFHCSHCGRHSQDSCQIDIQAVNDPINLGVVWYTNHKIKDFICPKCQARNLFFSQIKPGGKKCFLCRSCKRKWLDSHDLTKSVVSHFQENPPRIENFNFNQDRWDLRAINPNFDLKDIQLSTANFTVIQPDWFKQEVKNFIYYSCKADCAFGTIGHHLTALRAFSHYLQRTNVIGFHQINRSLILDYLVQEKKISGSKIGSLRSFFTTGVIKGWFSVEPDIIRSEDYPRQNKSNPDPLSKLVREQIERHLHKIPDPIARMWIICFFAAMRPSELALLKKDCLVQSGQQWKLIWYRKKTDDAHEIPISRTIAKVVQEQLQYINNLWGQDWEYLFCHYHGLSSTEPSQPKLKPVRKVIPNSYENPLDFVIRCLIKAENIKDENGQLAQFKPKLLRPTRLTQLFEMGHDLAVVSAWAGHKNLVTTSTYYTEVSCELMEQEGGHIQKALVNNDGKPVLYESLPKSFWETPQAHKLELEGTHINTPIYGFCGLSLDEDCHKFRACYTCPCFVAAPEKLLQYIKTRDELRGKKTSALTNGYDVLVEQFGCQADQLDKIIASLQEAV